MLGKKGLNNFDLKYFALFFYGSGPYPLLF